MKARARLFSLWEAIRTSYWFVPSVMAAGATLLSFATVALDHAVSDRWLLRTGWLYTGSAEGARELLSTIAGSMIGVAGVVFSITIVAMTLASNQFGPRLLRNFMRDLGNQIVLGTFIAAFLYCLLILRQVHGGNSPTYQPFVPQISLLVGVVLAVAGLVVLIYFIHHAAASIQAPHVIAAVADDLHEAIDELYPREMGTERSEPEHGADQVPSGFEEESVVIGADEAGYVQAVEGDDLMDLAVKHDLIVKVVHRPGQYVQGDDVILLAWPARRVSQDVRHDLHQTFTINNQRSLTQDAEFAIDQLVEIAARAMSPGINDPFTAMQCVDRLGEGLSQLAGRVIPSPFRLDEQGRLRVIAYPTHFRNFVDAALNQIRQDGQRLLAVLLRLLEALGRIARRARRPDDVACLREHAAMVFERAMAAATAEHDRRAVDRRYAALCQALDVK